mmetsp:Transcript_39389/g.35088  ORF Transcript_39389/g.35088 Transcript_39389/m.35088 type:complete len:239 (-) Transcript_39389:162-878(-)
MPVYDNLRTRTEYTLETVGLNILEHFNDMKNITNSFMNLVMTQKYYQAGQSYAQLILMVFKGVLTNPDYTSFYDISSTNYTNITYQVPNLNAYKSQMMRGISDEFGFNISRADINKCAAADTDFQEKLFPLINDLHNRQYEQFLEDLASSIPDFQSDIAECKTYEEAYLNQVLIPIFNSFKNDTEYTLKTVGLNILENFNEMKSQCETIGNDVRNLDFYQAGKDYADLIEEVFQGVLN